MILRLIGWGVWIVVFAVYGVSLLLLAALRLLVHTRRARDTSRGVSLLITGRFDSLNWCRAHLLPLAQATCVRKITAVVEGPTAEHPKIRYCGPPRLLVFLVGRAMSKTLLMMWNAIGAPPDVVIGYHIFPGALSALLIAKLVGARSIYQMTAGPVELIGGGAATENALLSRLRCPSPLLERLALKICRHFDTVVVRGRRARDFLSSRSAACNIEVIVGGVNVVQFANSCGPRCYDVAYVGRLKPIKQPDHVVGVVAALARYRPGVRAVMVGDGPLLCSLRAKAEALHVSRCIEFLGHVEAVDEILRRTKVFILTSRSEGLSIALAEAMAAGVVPVVADVGDLAELVQNGVTGWRVKPGDFDGYARRIHELLDDERQWRQLSDAARTRSCENNSLGAVVEKWERCLLRLAPEPARVGSVLGPPIVGHRSPIRPVGWSAYRYYRLWQRLPSPLKNVLARPIEAVPVRHRLGAFYGVCQRFANEVDRWPLKRAQTYQLAEIRRICRLAYEQTDFYRRTFRQAGLDPYRITDLDDLQKLPTIGRDTLRARIHEMCTVSRHARCVERISTGGTSGKPVRFYIGIDRSAIEYAYLVASWQRAGYQLGTAMAVFRGHMVPEDNHGLHHAYDPVLRHHFYSVFHMTDANMRCYLEHLATIGPCYLHVYPSSVAALARFVRRAGIRPPGNIRGIIAESEIVYHEQRRMVVETFACPYFSCYGHAEKLVLAAQCEHSTDYHVWPTYGYFELLDEDGQAVTTPGQRGEIVGTGFINRVVPFIRYRTGDYATYVGDRCEACGREHIIIRDIRGHRTQEVLIAMDGSEIPWAALNMHDDTFAHVRQFQFRQDTAGRAVLRVVKDVKRIRRNLGRKLDGQLVLTIELVENIPLSPCGKAVYVDQRIPQHGSEAKVDLV
jgi:phenylacetate-CoA ligase